MARQGQIVEIASLPGAALQWIHLAEPIFAEKGLNLEDYALSVMEKGDTVTVSARLTSESHVRGGTGYWVAFSKRTKKVLSQASMR